MTEGRGWFVPALAIVGLMTLWRVVWLWFDRTDLFVDEAQYWLWAQTPDFGYYSKPPMIAWVIGAVTGLLGSDSIFAVRLPAGLLHGVTALILGAAAARLWGRAAAVWTAATYVTLPFTAVGSAMISTDTILAPFYAAALYFLIRATEGRGLAWAILSGVALGGAFLSKYAAIYVVLALPVVHVLFPARRLSLMQTGLFLAAFVLAILPNVLWNLGHDLTTLSHTADNVAWVRDTSPLAGLSPASLAEFLASQFAVFGPLLFGALVLAFLRGRAGEAGWLLPFAAVPLLLVSVQALLSRAYANWAVTAYFAGTLIVVHLLLSRPGLLRASLALHAAVCLAVPVLTAVAPAPRLGDAPLLQRYLGRADLSRQIIEAARAAGVSTVYATDRDILADLFHTGRDTELSFVAPAREGRPRNYYEQVHPIPADLTGPILAVTTTAPSCAGTRSEAVARFDTAGGAHEGRDFAAYVLEADCVRKKR